VFSCAAVELEFPFDLKAAEDLGYDYGDRACAESLVCDSGTDVQGATTMYNA